MRVDTIYLSANSFLYDLRVTASLIAEHNLTLSTSPGLEAAFAITESMIRRIEDATEIVLVQEDRTTTEAGLGS